MNDTFEPAELESLPRWARKAYEQSAQPQAAPSILDYREHDAWPMLVGAATVSTFLPGELMPPAMPADQRRDAEKAVLRFAEPSYEADARKWSLTSDARKAILSTIDTANLPSLQDSSADPLTRAVRDILRGERTAGYESNDMRELEATRLAASWLSDVKALQPPSIADLDRQIELRRLLSPFEFMVGRVPGVGTEPPANRFFGRAKEMTQLRHYVGAVPASSLVGLARRAASNLYYTLAAREPMSIWGTGGVGKTTLIAQFMLDHTEAARSRFPFAYLDFDRSTLSSRNPLGLLGEMCQQVGAQFAELTAPMSALRNELAELSRKFEKNPDEGISIVSQYAQQFRTHVDTYLTNTESRFEFARPFLLVLDTFEIVQYVPDQVAGLEYFVRAFSKWDESTLWPRLRLVISGRSRIDEFIVKIAKSDVLELGALDRDGSANMLVAYATDAGKPITIKDALRLVDAIVKAAGEKPKSGVRPLRLRLVATLFADAEVQGESGPAIVEKLIAELQESNATAGVASTLFVDGILVRRILDHVSDRRVRALADPGLVVRRITPEVIRRVMARGTSDPAKGGGAPGDVLPAEPWDVSEETAREIFEAFRREVSLVESDDRAGAPALRHRQDVRRDMLPLIKARRHTLFLELHRLAYDYFSANAQSDPAASAEALYHALWLDKPFEELDRFWRDDARIDPGEFEPGSRAHIYLRLRSKKTKDALSVAELKRLPPEMALDWLSAHSEELLKRRRLSDSLSTIRSVAGAEFEKLADRPELAAVVARLLYRGGRWHDAAQVIRAQLPPAVQHTMLYANQVPASLVSVVRLWATIAARSAAPPAELEAIAPLAMKLTDPMARIEACAHLLISLRGHGAPSGAELVNALERAIAEVPRHQWSREPRILRLAILASAGHELVPRFVATSERLPRDPDVSKRLSSLAGWNDVLGDLLHREPSRDAGDALDVRWRSARDLLLSMTLDNGPLSDLRAIIAFDHSDWAQALGNAVTRLMTTDARQARHAFEPLLKLPDMERALSRNDGRSAIQIASDEGRFLEVAARLSEAPPVEAVVDFDLIAPSLREHPWQYPDSAADIARALMAWHRAALSGPEPQPSAVAS